MRKSSTLGRWKRFLSAATMIGAAVFSLPASATTLTPGNWEYVPTGLVDGPYVFITVYVAGNPPFTGTMQFNEVAANGDLLPLGAGLSAVYFIASTQRGEAGTGLNRGPGAHPLGEHMIRASYSGDPANPPATLTFTILVADPGFLPAVLMDIL